MHFAGRAVCFDKCTLTNVQARRIYSIVLAFLFSSSTAQTGGGGRERRDGAEAGGEEGGVNSGLRVINRLIIGRFLGGIVAATDRKCELLRRAFTRANCRISDPRRPLSPYRPVIELHFSLARERNCPRLSGKVARGLFATAELHRCRPSRRQSMNYYYYVAIDRPAKLPRRFIYFLYTHSALRSRD